MFYQMCWIPVKCQLWHKGLYRPLHLGTYVGLYQYRIKLVGGILQIGQLPKFCFGSEFQEGFSTNLLYYKRICCTAPIRPCS